MKISLYLGVLFLTIVIKIVTADVSDSREPNSAQQYCGSKLADIMSIICKGHYNMGKRNLIGKLTKIVISHKINTITEHSTDRFFKTSYQ